MTGEHPEPPCNCEHESHFDSGPGHAHMMVPAGANKAQHVGRVCDDCARTHMAPYLIVKH